MSEKELRRNISSLQRKANELRRKCVAYADSNLARKESLRQHEAFCQWLLKEGRVTKEEMRPFFKRIEDVRTRRNP